VFILFLNQHPNSVVLDWQLQLKPNANTVCNVLVFSFLQLQILRCGEYFTHLGRSTNLDCSKADRRQSYCKHESCADSGDARKLSYRKDDRAMRLIYECPENFRESLSKPSATFAKIFSGLLFWSILWVSGMEYCTMHIAVCYYYLLQVRVN